MTDFDKVLPSVTGSGDPLAGSGMTPAGPAGSVESGGPAGSVEPPDLAVWSEGLTKRFGNRTVVRDVALAVPRGCVYGFLGPNGSGKTTTIRMLLGLVRPNAGRCGLLGHEMPRGGRHALPHVGALVEGPAFHAHLSGRANLARLDAVDATTSSRNRGRRIERALERVGLAAAAGKRYRAYSLGMKQRLALAAALLTPRDLMVLDEPTNGLDPQGTREIRSLVGELSADGTTVLISSHLLSEIEQVCSHIGIMSAGALVAQGEVGALRAAQRPTVAVRTRDPTAAVTVLTQAGLDDLRVVGADLVTGDPGDREPEPLVAALVHAGVPVRGFEVRRPGLEDLFVALTGEGFDVEG